MKVPEQCNVGLLERIEDQAGSQILGIVGVGCVPAGAVEDPPKRN